MRGAHKQRGMAAPRVAQELPGIQHLRNSPRRGLSDTCWCCGNSSKSSSRVWGRQRRCGCSWRVSPLFSRKATRQSFAVVLLCLAGAFSLRGWRAAMMIDSAPFRGGRWTTSSSDALSQQQQQQLWLNDEPRNDQCGWEPGGPVLFNVEHSKMHADGEALTQSRDSGDHAYKYISFANLPCCTSMYIYIGQFVLFTRRPRSDSLCCTHRSMYPRLVLVLFLKPRGVRVRERSLIAAPACYRGHHNTNTAVEQRCWGCQPAGF